MQVLRADKTGEIELSGTSHELSRLAQAIRSKRETFRLDTSVDPSPYSRALSRIESTQTMGDVALFVSSDREALVIQGGAELLAILALNIEEFAVEDDETAHLHIEYFPGHEYLSPRSEALVVALKVK